MATANVGNDSGLGSSGTIQVNKELLEALTEEVADSVIALYNKNSDNGETDDVAVWAADRVKKLCAHAASFTAAKIVKEIQERRKKAGADLLEAVAELMTSATKDGGGGSSGSGSALNDRSTSEIKYPWQKQEELGRGGFGVVFRAKGADGFLFAVKEVERKGPEAECLREEIKCLTKLSHANVVRCFGFAEGRGKIFMYLELMNGSVLDKMNKANNACTRPEVRRFTRDIVRGLAYLHGKDMIHRDIKCANVLVDGSGKAKLGDMGLTKPHTEQTVADYSEGGGTVLWMSPESITEHKTGKRADVWSLACTVYEMMKRMPTFAEWGIMGFLILISGGNDGFSKHKDLITNDKTIPNIIKSFLLEIFVPLDNRPYIERIANHEWLSFE